jgi:hypothetical protein
VVQTTAAKFVQCLSSLSNHCQYEFSKEVLLQLGHAVSDPASIELLVQLLTMHTILLHQHCRTHMQQQKQQQQRLQHSPGTSSSSSSNARRCGQGLGQPSVQSSKQLRTDLLPIPAFHQHQDMLQLLPGGQAYLDTAAAGMASRAFAGGTDAAAEAFKRASMYAAVLVSAVSMAEQHQALERSSPVLSTAVLRLVMELQLLAAWVVQQQQQQQPSGLQGPYIQSMQLKVNLLLLMLLKAGLQASGSCLPPELLQQHGLQLLRALAAPVQQLLLSSQGNSSYLSSAPAEDECRGEQMFALRAAAVGVTAVPNSVGESG